MNDNLAGCVVWALIAFVASALTAVTVILWKAAL